MLSVRVVLLLLLAMSTGCRADKCRGADPAFELVVSLPPSPAGHVITGVIVLISVEGREKQFPVAVAAGQTELSLAVTVGDIGRNGFIARVNIFAIDGAGVRIAAVSGSFQASGDACNFFSLGNARPLDGGLDVVRLDSLIDRDLPHQQ